MLLIDWWAETGVPLPRTPHQGNLDKILRFVFGEHYLVQMLDGHNYEDKTLDPILSIISKPRLRLAEGRWRVVTTEWMRSDFAQAAADWCRRRNREHWVFFTERKERVIQDNLLEQQDVRTQ